MSSINAGRRQILSQSKSCVPALAAAADHARATDTRGKCVDLISRIYEIFDAEEAITGSQEIVSCNKSSFQ